MKFIDFVTGGNPSQMRVFETDTPEPGDEQVLIEVQAFGINRADTLQRQGKYPPPKGESEILGLEVAGKVAKTGKGVTDWEVGDEVFGLVPGGGYAQYVVAHQSHVLPIPKNITKQEAAGIAEVFLTAYQSLFYLGKLRKDQKVLIHAGASGVGLAAIQLAKHHGAQVAVTASNTEKLNLCAAKGADLLVNYRQQNFAEVIKEHWGSVDLIVDFIGGDYLNRNLKVIRQDGTIVYLAMLAGRFADQLDMAMLLGKRARIIGSTLRNRSDQYKSELIADFRRDYLQVFELGDMHPNIDSYYSAQDISLAHERLESNQTMGKLIGLWDD